MNLTKKFFTLLMAVFPVSCALAQETPADTTPQAIAAMQAILNNLSKIKISGYIQGQFQVADSTGIKSYAGGDFPVASDKRFMLRRGRIKVVYDNTLTQFVLQIDATEKGVVLKDAYAKVTEPWLQTFGLSVGIMNRPFGFEIGYSSSMRESPERGRMSQIIFPGERDLGAMLTIEPPKTSKLNFFKIEAGLFNGTGNSTPEFDKTKDFIGHLVLRKSVLNEKLKLSGGVSIYNGGWRADTANLYSEIITDATGIKKFKLDPDTLAVGRIMKRNYFGFDFQLSYETPVIGITTFRAEYIGGVQTGTKSSNDSPKELPVDSKTKLESDAFQRNFNGAYFYLLQNIGKLPLQLILKYDWYDPNTKVKGDEITSALTAADIKYTTTGIGLAYRYDQNIKFTAYYDIVKNESTQLSGYTKDLKDNVFTIRMQYKF
jgi:hypothetical protein